MDLIRKAYPKRDEILTRDNRGPPYDISQMPALLGIARPNAEDVHCQLGIPLLDSPEFAALQGLLNNPGFFRAWIWQECFLAKERRFYLGPRTWSGDRMYTVCSILATLCHSSRNPQYSPTGSIHFLFKVLHMLYGAEPRRTGLEKPPERFQKLLALLMLQRGSGCALPSDLIYSILGSAVDCPMVRVDYAQPFETVFARSTWQMMVQNSSLSILSLVERNRQASNLPTWAPDWRIREDHFEEMSNYLSPGLQYAATGTSRLAVRLSNDTKMISLSGLAWDRVSAVHSASSEKVEAWVDGMFDTLRDSKKFYIWTNEPLERALRRVTLADTTLFTLRTTRWQPKSHTDFETIVANASSNGQQGRLDYGRLVHAIASNRRSRNILVSQKGRLGMASDKLREGDVIAMLLGGEVPLVLRPSDDDGHYTFVAECYVHGFIDGEALVEARKSAQPEYDPVNVSWVKRLHEEDVPFPVQEFHIH